MPLSLVAVVRRRALSCSLLAAASLAACSAGRPAAPEITPPDTPAYHQADAECRDVAVRETENVTPQTAASKAAIGIYFRCMTEKGFPPPGARTPAPR